jgi:GntR family transcriptional regulator
MLATINIHSFVPVYEQIENHVQFAISAGDLKAGDRLPSVKELAERLGVNFNTVAKAYRDLEVMGIIYTRRGMGCFINKGLEATCKEKCRARIVTHLHEVVQEAKAAGLGKKDLGTVVTASMDSDATVYGDVPASVMKLSKV